MPGSLPASAVARDPRTSPRARPLRLQHRQLLPVLRQLPLQHPDDFRRRPLQCPQRILVPLDHSDADHEAIGNALAIARSHDARIILLHIEEGVTSQMFGALSSTAEITEGQDYLAGMAASLRKQNVSVDVVVRHGTSPAHEIAAAARDLSPDLVVMASHGHSGIKDLIFGTTINSVRHHLRAPLLIVSKNMKSE